MAKINNLPLFMGLSEKGDEIISDLLKNDYSLAHTLARLTNAFKVRVCFSEPVTRQIKKHWTIENKTEGHTIKRLILTKTADTHVFNKLMIINGSLHYTKARNARWAYPFPHLDKVVSYEPVSLNKRRQEFKNFEEFKRKFNPLFITDTEIQNLWNQKSAQHGGRYRPADFHKLGPRGRQTLKKFLIQFKGVPNPEGGPGYHTNEYGSYLTERYHSYHHTGRDITISHNSGAYYVTYSSEYHGCGNGRYGLLANKNEFLWLEDD